MWNILVIINSVFLSIASLFLVYAIGAAILRGEWKQLLFAFLLFLFLGVAEIALGAINMS